MIFQFENILRIGEKRFNLAIPIAIGSKVFLFHADLKRLKQIDADLYNQN